MFHKAVDLKFKDGTILEMTFQDGLVKQYDMAVLFEKYPQLKALENRELFLSGKLMGMYGIVWNDDLDIEAETIYEDGIIVRQEKPAENIAIGEAVMSARTEKGFTQKELARASGINQADISKIEKGIANPSVTISLNEFGLEKDDILITALPDLVNETDHSNIIAWNVNGAYIDNISYNDNDNTFKIVFGAHMYLSMGNKHKVILVFNRVK